MMMMMTDDERRVISLTNHGIRLLQQRNHRQASQCMLQALNHVKESIKKTSSNKRQLVQEKAEKDVASTADKNVLTKNNNGFCIHPISSPPSTPSIPLGRDDSTTSLPFQMFDRVFGFSTNATTCSKPLAWHTRDGSSAMLLYNLGVTNHSRAMESVQQQQGGVTNKLSLRKALQMYTWALSAVQHWARHYDVHDGCHLLRLAILNNMAHVHALLGTTAKAQHCLKCLRDILGHTKGFVSQTQYAFFTANIVVLCLRKGGDGTNDDGDNNNDLLTIAPAPAA